MAQDLCVEVMGFERRMMDMSHFALEKEKGMVIDQFFASEESVTDDYAFSVLIFAEVLSTSHQSV